MTKPEEAGPVPMRLKAAAPETANIVTAGTLLASMAEMRELSLLRPASSIAVQVFLAFDDLQKIMDAVTKAYNAADDKRAIVETEIELPFQPFPVEMFTGEAMSIASFVKLNGWLLKRRETTVKLPVFPPPGAGAVAAQN